MLKSLLLVGLGGFTGSCLRYIISLYLNNNKTVALPYGTLLANLLGSFLLGYFMALLLKNGQPNGIWGLLLITGFCGGFTTFSTFSFENFSYLQNGDYLLFFIYTIASVLLAIALVAGGFWLGKTI